MQCPRIDPQLIRYLDKMFPDVAVDPTKPNAAQHYGAVLVVRHLKLKQQEQESDIDVRP